MKVLMKFTLKNLNHNRSRFIVTMIGVILTSFLMFGLGLGVSTVREAMIYDEYRNTGKYHVLYDNLPFVDYDILLQNEYVKTVEYEKELESFIYQKGKNKNQTITLFDRNGYHLQYFELEEGRYPLNGKEIIISKRLAQMMGNKINEKVSFSNMEYQIVGIYHSDNYLEYMDRKEKIYTNSGKVMGKVNFYVLLNSSKNAYQKIISISDALQLQPIYSYNGLSHEHENIQNGLLELEGENRNYGKLAVLFLSLLLLLTVLSFASIIVIYNSFAISVTERKKLLGILSSLGATRWQILLSVMIEAFIVSLIAIPIGLLLSFGGVELLLLFLNFIMKDVHSYSYVISIYPIFLWVSLIFIIISIYLSAFFPAMRAFEVTPLEAIKSNDDIKLKRKSVKSPILIQKIFGFEALIAHKNSKRNKKKYRITILSLFVSIVLFITISTFVNHYVKFVHPFSNQEEFDVTMRVSGQIDRIGAFYDDLTNHLDVRYQYYGLVNAVYESEKEIVYESTYNKEQGPFGLFLFLMILKDGDYNLYLNKIGYQKEKPIIVNYAKWDVYENDDFFLGELLKTEESKIFKNITELNFHLSILDSSNGLNQMERIPFSNITDFYETDKLPDGFTEYHQSPIMIMSEGMYQQLCKGTILENRESVYAIHLKTDDYYQIEKRIQKIIGNYSDISIFYDNPSYQLYLVNQQLFFYRFLLYFVIAFILFIAVTSVFNTIYTNIKLRKKEFAMLRSVGMTKKGFRKMIFFESFLFGFKSLLYGITASIFLILIIFKIQNLISANPSDSVLKMTFPTNYVLMTIIGVMLIVFLAMFYSIRKIEKENIIDVLKEDSY